MRFRIKRTIATTSRICTQYAAEPKLMKPMSHNTISNAIKNHIALKI